MDISQTLSQLREQGNFRTIPSETPGDVVDLSSNDYLGLAARADLRGEFFGSLDPADALMSASASRLLGARQREFNSLERTLASAYGRPALMFNSGYHANVGLVQALAGRRTLILADRLVHASIIDGIRLSGADFLRFRHNDFDHLLDLARAKANDYDTLLVIVESVYSMDGDRADIDRLVDVKRSLPDGRVILYVDEAHAVGVEGPAGLGLVAASSSPDSVDIVVGTLGKALASVGAFAIMNSELRDYMVNKARSLIFSTALPPLCAAWSEFIFRRSLTMDDERRRLAAMSVRLGAIVGAGSPGHIRPLVVGDPRRAVSLSAALLARGFKVMPIRTPTVPPGTERLRFSLSAAVDPADLDRLDSELHKILQSYEA